MTKKTKRTRKALKEDLIFNNKMLPIAMSLVVLLITMVAIIYPKLDTRASTELISLENVNLEIIEGGGSINPTTNAIEIDKDHRYWWNSAGADSTQNVDVTTGSQDKDAYFFPSIGYLDTFGNYLLATWSSSSVTNPTGDLFVQKINPDGTSAGWGAGGAGLSLGINQTNHNNRYYNPQALGLNDFGFILFYDGSAIRSQRITEFSGNPLVGFSSDPQNPDTTPRINSFVSLSGFSYETATRPPYGAVSESGVMVATYNLDTFDQTYDINLTRMNSTGDLQWSWDPSLDVVGDPNTADSSLVEGITESGDDYFDMVAVDGGVVITWMEGCNIVDSICDLKAIKVLDDGSIDSGLGWTQAIDTNAKASKPQILFGGAAETVILYKCQPPASSEGLCGASIKSDGNHDNVWDQNKRLFDFGGDATVSFTGSVGSGGNIWIGITNGNQSIQKLMKINGTNGDWDASFTSSGITLDFDVKSLIVGDLGTMNVIGIDDVSGDAALVYKLFLDNGTVAFSGYYNDPAFLAPDMGNFIVLSDSEGIVTAWDQTDLGGDHSIYAQKFTLDGGDYLPKVVARGSVDPFEEDIVWDSLNWTAIFPDAAASIDIELRLGDFAITGPNDTNLALSGQMSASSEAAVCNGSCLATYANDGGLLWGSGTGWVNDFSNINLPEWLSVDLGSEGTVGRVILYSADPFEGNTPFIPTDYEIQTSTDGTNWATQITVPGDVDENNDITIIQHNFEPVQARYARLLLNSLPNYSGIDGVIITEFEVYSGPASTGSGWYCDLDIPDDCPKVTLNSLSGSSGTIDLATLLSSQGDGIANGFQFQVTLNKGSTPTLSSISVSGTPASAPPPPTPVTSLPPTYSPGSVEEIGNEILPDLSYLLERLRALEKRITTLENEDVSYVAEPEPISNQTYTVQRGDYLISIARIVYGDEARWPELVSLNKYRYPELVAQPNALKIGWILQY